MVITKITSEEILKAKPTMREMRLRKRTPIYAMLDNIRSLYNVGAMFRLSDAALVSKVFLIGQTGKPPRKEIDKSALGATDVVHWEYSFPICLVVGNEVNGISQDIFNMCDSAIDIPMLGKANSLNVATAYGIALFEILKQFHHA